MIPVRTFMYFTSSQNFALHAWRALREKNLNNVKHNLANWIIYAT